MTTENNMKKYGRYILFVYRLWEASGGLLDAVHDSDNLDEIIETAKKEVKEYGAGVRCEILDRVEGVDVYEKI